LQHMDASATMSQIAHGQWLTFRLLGVDVHAVREPRVGHAACLRLLSDHITQATRGAGLRVVVGNGDVHGAVGGGGAHGLQGPLLPLHAVVGGANHRTSGLPIVTGLGASGARLVQEAQKLGCGAEPSGQERSRSVESGRGLTSGDRQTWILNHFIRHHTAFGAPAGPGLELDVVRASAKGTCDKGGKQLR